MKDYQKLKQQLAWGYIILAFVILLSIVFISVFMIVYLNSHPLQTERTNPLFIIGDTIMTKYPLGLVLGYLFLYITAMMTRKYILKSIPYDNNKIS